MGLRSQLLLALGGLCLLAFVPLFFAVTSLSRATLRLQQEAELRMLGRAVAERLVDAQTFSSSDEIQALAHREMALNPMLWGCSLWSPQGALLWSTTTNAALAWPDANVLPPLASTLLRTPQGNAWQSWEHSSAGSVAVLVAAEERVSAPLTRLVAFYTASIAICLMIFLYAALTRLVIQPLGALTRAAERVASGARSLEMPRRGGAELRALGASVAIMTRQLREEEEQLRQQVLALEHANRRLQAAQQQVVRSAQLASVGRLAAGLAHEVGNPLAALVGLQDLVLTAELAPEEQKDFLVRMRQETERIHRIVQNLLDFSRPSDTSIPGRLVTPGHVEPALHDVLALLRHQPRAHEVVLRVTVEPELPAVTLGQGELIQVFMNLLLNAIDAVGPAGTIEIRARTRDPSTVSIDIEDNGPGVDPRVRDTLFEPFVTTKAVGQGTGLGLAVCRGLLEAVGGALHVHDRDMGQSGAIFRIGVPSFFEPEPVESLSQNGIQNSEA